MLTVRREGDEDGRGGGGDDGGREKIGDEDDEYEERVKMTYKGDGKNAAKKK